MIRPRSKKGRWALAVGSIAVFGFAVWLLGWSGVLGVRTIDVVGTERASESLVVLTADIATGTPLARIDTQAIAERVESLRIVSKASVQRSWPQTVRIVVTERQAVSAVPTGGAFRLIDAEGVDFATVDRAPPGTPLLAVRLAQASPAEVAAGVAVASSLPSELASRVKTIRVKGPEDVRLLMRSGATVIWGDATLADQKAVVVAALLKRGVDRVDVRAPEAPTSIG